MTTWRPPTTPHERTTRAIRSMQNGSLDGRLVNAFPAKLFDPDQDAAFDELEELPEDVTKGGDSLLPWTDYFYPQTGQATFRYTLSHFPWVQEAMPSLKNRATVHVYWNGIFQTDVHYTLSGRIITIDDPLLNVRSGDTLSVKYWYDKTGGTDPEGDEDPYPGYEEYRLNCAFMGAGGYGGIPSVYASGALSYPPTGQNYGSVALVATGYESIQFGASWSTGFWVPKGMNIPYRTDIEDIRLTLWGPSNGNPSIMIGRVGSICASGSQGDSVLFQDCTVCTPYTGLRNVNSRCSAERGGAGPTSWMVDQRTPGPPGGCEFASGDLAYALVAIARLGVSINWRYNGGNAGGGCVIRLNSTTDGDVDNTIYANRNLYLGNFPVTTGVTAYIKRK